MGYSVILSSQQAVLRKVCTNMPLSFSGIADCGAEAGEIARFATIEVRLCQQPGIGRGWTERLVPVPGSLWHFHRLSAGTRVHDEWT